MPESKTYDCCIIGGGLAGLALSIQLAKSKFSVALFEKEKYPFHKVCGEYISLESWDFLKSLGLPLDQMNLPIIKTLQVTAPDGNSLQQQLPLGGFGISRYKLDAMLKEIAEKGGVHIFEECKVNAVNFEDDIFRLKTSKGDFVSTVCCGSFGKRSNLDIKWHRRFVQKKNSRINNFIGVKYHVKINIAPDSIALHNFKDGYCGISQVEDGICCLCYLTTSKNLVDNDQSIPAMEKNVLQQNPHLKEIFTNSKMLYQQPLAISQISFDKKTQVENNVLMLGDAAGLITPLCGNGMSMAMHSSKIAASLIEMFLSGKIDRAALEKNYTHQWRSTFAKRLRTGRLIQSMFGKPGTTNLFISIMKKMPAVTRWLIRQTHGKPF